MGVSAALFLAARGVTPVLVEKHPTISTRLRAKLFHPRTMEAYRAVGVAESVYAIERALPPADHAAVVESLAGSELERWRLPAAEDFSAVSPWSSALVKQADLEEVVPEHPRHAGVELRFGHRFLGLRTPPAGAASPAHDYRICGCPGALEPRSGARRQIPAAYRARLFGIKPRRRAADLPRPRNPLASNRIRRGWNHATGRRDPT